jgi:hypothetical protein
MHTGIYISGLGQSFHTETVEKYAARLMNEIRYNKTGTDYELKVEKVSYAAEKESTVVYIRERGDEAKVIYKFYDFQYNKILTDRFNRYNILVKNALLLLLVLKKFPILLKRLFLKDNFDRPFQTFYVFLIFLVVSLAILLLIPAALELAMGYVLPKEVSVLIPQAIRDFFNRENVNAFLKSLVPITTIALLLVPQARTMAVSLATEFACVDSYLQSGSQGQLILGNLDLLVEYIAEQERDAEIHFHTYSFGSMIAIDYLFPFGNIPSGNARKLSRLLISIGSPYQFIKSYYPDFYKERNMLMEEQVSWINIYSVADALATNFRKDAKAGEAQFGIEKSKLLPFNINYEVTPVKSFSIFSFLSLYYIQIHNKYWDPAPEGQNCLRKLYHEMNRRQLLP